jgi:hypothetical protein
MERLTQQLLRTAAGGAAALALAAGGCGHGASAPSRLVDGTPPPKLPAALKLSDRNTVTSRVTVTSIGRLGATGRNCVDGFRPEFRLAVDATVVRRTGIVGESVTFMDADHDVVLGCDRTDGPAPASQPWCGRSVGRLVGGRLRDLRLDIACRTRRGTQVGFGWIETGPGTRWVAARVGAVTEVAGVAAGLPVRVVTEDIDRETSSATFATVEYAGSGKTLARHRISAGVAG